MLLKFKLFTWSPKQLEIKKPFYSLYSISSDELLNSNKYGSMLLDVLIGIKNNLNPLISFRRSCREGICGSCAMNYNGTNVLACTTQVDTSTSIHLVHPLPHLPVIRDLVVDMNYFYFQHKNVQPFLKRFSSIDLNLLKWFKKQEIIQSRENRNRVDGLYECILCACCSTSCPSYWWNQSEYYGPAILLQTYRWLSDSRDVNSVRRINKLFHPFKVFRCHSILNCSKVCPKGLDPAYSISSIKSQIDNLLVEKYLSA